MVHFASAVVSLYLPTGSIIFIPAGCLATWTLVPQPEDANPKQKKPTSIQNAYVVALPVYEESMLDYPANVKAAIKMMNEDHFRQKAASQMWQARADTFTKFLPLNLSSVTH